MALTPGTRLGPYEILASAGAGGMGEVYRARDTRLDRTVAIKVLPEHFSQDADLKQRFEREARAISSLNHPNICTLYDVGHQDGTDYLVMEFVEGETLSIRLQRGPLPLEQALKTGGEIAEALDKAHRQGIVHRDLKPGNIMLTKSGAKLLDFGLAKPASGAKAASGLTGVALTQTSPASPITQQGHIVGTFQYMSPEQVEGREADARSDIFALGAVLYEMATGRRAFEGKSAISVASAILERDPEPISKLQPLVPAAFARVIEKCLAKDPDQRWQSAKDLAGELDWIASHDSPPAAAAHPRGAMGRERLWWSAAVLIVAALAAWAAYSSRPARDERVLRFDVYPPDKTEFIPNFAISPDGTRLAVVGFDGQAHKVYLRSLDSPRVDAVNGTENAADVFWSPDNRSLGFFTPGRLKKIELSTGDVVDLATIDAIDGAWNRDGTILMAPNGPTPLVRVSSNGGTPEPATQLDPARQDVFHDFPQFLPDGEHFLFYVKSAKEANTGIYVGSLKSKEKRFVLQTPLPGCFAPPGYLLFVRGHALVAQRFDLQRFELSGDVVPVVSGIAGVLGARQFSPSAHGEIAYNKQELLEHLEWADRTGKSLARVGDEGNLYGFDLSPDGNEIAVERADNSTWPDIWLMDLKRNLSSRLTFTGAAQPIWSPDGKHLVYTSLLGNDLMYRDATSSEKETLLVRATGASTSPNSWAPDGKTLLYNSEDVAGVSKLWALPMQPDAKPYLVSRGTASERQGCFSPDGKWLAYTSNESGRDEVYIQPFPPTGERWQVSGQGGSRARWRRDGKEIFYLDRELHLMAAPVELGPKPQIGAAKVLFQLRVPATWFGSTLINFSYGVSADGQRFLVNPHPEGSSNAPISIVVDWSAGLKK